MTKAKKLNHFFYRRDTTQVAQELLGKKLVRIFNGKRLSGFIVETEAYLGARDRAAHTAGGHRSERNEVMYGPGGFAYVYMIYGMHFCLNAVTKNKGEPEAVLIRALEPLEGLEDMIAFRKRKKTKELCSGPGKLCQAMDIEKNLNGADLYGDELFIEDGGLNVKANQIVATTRVGVDYAGPAAKWPLRFYIKDNLNVSRT